MVDRVEVMIAAVILSVGLMMLFASAIGRFVSNHPTIKILALSFLVVVGVTLIAAALVVPPVIARMLTDSFGRMLVLSTLVGGASGLVGMYLSYHLDVSSGATIVLLDFAAFAVVFAVTGTRGLRRLGRVTGPAAPVDR